VKRKRIIRRVTKVYDGPATMEIKIQYESGSITTSHYLLPDLLMAESVFEKTCDTARSLSDAAHLLYETGAYKHIRPYMLPKRGE
jgi:hypothetical protein